MAQLLQPKEQLDGYEILELVGKGGMGEVYRARQMSMQRVVALKVLTPRLAKQDPSFARRFVEEARAAGRLNHPNIIAVHDVGKGPMPNDPAGELEYFSMEFIDGESVKDVIERQGSCPLSLISQVMLGMSEALAYAEAQGIVHRDVKPDNIMITGNGVAKLADLGLALQLGGEDGVSEKDEKGRGKVMGTPLYMSPEQARALPVDSRSDQYSLGATLFHMLTGKPPYRGANAKAIMKAHVFDPIPDPRQLQGDVPEPWRQLCMRLMEKPPASRFGSCAEMRKAVLSAVNGITVPVPSRRVRSSKGSAQGSSAAMPGWAKALVYAFAAAVLAMVVIFSQNDRSDPDAPHAGEQPRTGQAQDHSAIILKQIESLPKDLRAALQQIDALMREPDVTPQVHEVLASKQRALLREEELRREHQHAHRMQVEVDAVTHAMDEGDLRDVQARLQRFAQQRPTLMADQQAALQEVQRRLESAQKAIVHDCTLRMAQAKNLDDLHAVLVTVDAAALADSDAKALHELADHHADALTHGQTHLASRDALAQALTAYFTAAPAQRAAWTFPAALDEQLAAHEDAVRAKAWTAFCAAERGALLPDFSANVVNEGSTSSHYVVRLVGSRPAHGWGLVIALHSGAGANKAINDAQWAVMQHYYTDQPQKPGYIYCALRAPNDSWNGFFDSYICPFITKLIRQFVVCGNVDPQRVYLIGYSHGGYGAFTIGPKMPDRFAFIHSSAAAPIDGQSSAMTLRTTPFTYWVGGLDNDFGRRDRCIAFDKLIKALRGDRTDIYPVFFALKSGVQHSDLPDHDYLAEMLDAERNPVPREITWEQTDSIVNRFFWLGCEPVKGQEISANCRDNRIAIASTNANLGALSIWLDSRLIDVNQPITVRWHHEERSYRIKPSLKTLCETMAERGDPLLAFSMHMTLGAAATSAH